MRPQVSIAIAPDKREKIKRKALSQGLTMTELINNLLDQWLEDKPSVGEAEALRLQLQEYGDRLERLEGVVREIIQDSHSVPLREALKHPERY